MTDLKRDDCKSAYGIDSGHTSYRLLAVQAVLLRGHRRSSDERNWTASHVLPDRADRRGLFEPRLRRSAHHPPVRPKSGSQAQLGCYRSSKSKKRKIWISLNKRGLFSSRRRRQNPKKIGAWPSRVAKCLVSRATGTCSLTAGFRVILQRFHPARADSKLQS